jgi:hypothetical protein
MALCLEQLNNNSASLQQLSDQLHSNEQAIVAIDLDALTSDLIKASDTVTSAIQTCAEKKAAMAGIEQIVITHGDHVPASNHRRCSRPTTRHHGYASTLIPGMDMRTRSVSEGI